MNIGQLPPSRANIMVKGPIMSIGEVNSKFLEMGLTASDLKPIDWRVISGCLSKIKDQGVCGDCWAMSSTSALADRFIIQKEEPGVNLEPGVVAQCVPDGLNKGCGGGSPYDAGQYFENSGTYKIEGKCPSWASLCLKGCDPLPTCQELLSYCGGNELYKAKKGSTQYLITSNGNNVDVNGTIANIKRELLNGPVVASFFVPCDFMVQQLYPWKNTNGIFINGSYGNELEALAKTNPGLNNFRSQNNINSAPDWGKILQEEGQNAGHAVSIVGWDYGDAGKIGRVAYWIVRNSWGSNWGENGFFRIAMNDGTGNNTQLGFDIPVPYANSLFGGCVKFDPDLSTGCKQNCGTKIVCDKGVARKVDENSESKKKGMTILTIVLIILGALLASIGIYFIMDKLTKKT